MADNEVHLHGRVSGEPEPRTLPSGDLLVALRVVVPRAADRRGAAVSASGRARVDAIDVTCWSGSTRKIAVRLRDGDEVELDGALRRRFFRSGSAVQSRYDVEVRSLRRVSPRRPTSSGQVGSARPPPSEQPLRRWSPPSRRALRPG